jgi:hypothetical protein
VKRKHGISHELWEYTGEELIGGAEITSDVILAPEIEMPWESDKVEGIISMPSYAAEAAMVAAAAHPLFRPQPPALRAAGRVTAETQLNPQ